MISGIVISKEITRIGHRYRSRPICTELLILKSQRERRSKISCKITCLSTIIVWIKKLNRFRKKL